MSVWRAILLDDDDLVVSRAENHFSCIRVVGATTIDDFFKIVKSHEEEDLAISTFLLDYTLSEDPKEQNGGNVARELRKKYPLTPIFLVSSQRGAIINSLCEELRMIYINKGEDFTIIEDQIISNLNYHGIPKISQAIEEGLTLDEDKCLVFLKDISVKMRSKEFALVKILSKYLGDPMTEGEIRKDPALKDVKLLRQVATVANKSLCHLGVEIVISAGSYTLMLDSVTSRGHIVQNKHNSGLSQYTLGTSLGVFISHDKNNLVGPNGRAPISGLEFDILHFFLNRMGELYDKKTVFKGKREPNDEDYLKTINNVLKLFKEAKISDVKVKGNKTTLKLGFYREES